MSVFPEFQAMKFETKLDSMKDFLRSIAISNINKVRAHVNAVLSEIDEGSFLILRSVLYPKIS